MATDAPRRAGPNGAPQADADQMPRTTMCADCDRVIWFNSLPEFKTWAHYVEQWEDHPHHPARPRFESAAGASQPDRNQPAGSCAFCGDAVYRNSQTGSLYHFEAKFRPDWHTPVLKEGPGEDGSRAAASEPVPLDVRPAMYDYPDGTTRVLDTLNIAEVSIDLALCQRCQHPAHPRPCGECGCEQVHHWAPDNVCRRCGQVAHFETDECIPSAGPDVWDHDYTRVGVMHECGYCGVKEGYHGRKGQHRASVPTAPQAHHQEDRGAGGWAGIACHICQRRAGIIHSTSEWVHMDDLTPLCANVDADAPRPTTPPWPGYQMVNLSMVRECMTCGALYVDQLLHDKWHDMTG